MSAHASSTTAVVLTHRRPRLATSLVRSLVERDGVPPQRVVLVVDRDGGLDDPALEASIRVIRLDTNAGPGAGFRVGLAEAFADPSTEFAYLCEDDVELTGLPTPRIAGLVDEVRRYEASSPGAAVGAVVAYGRKFDHRHAGTTVAFQPDPGGPRLQDVDVAAWGATLVTRRVHQVGVAPDDHWFFGYEDFDFFLKVRAADLRVLVDRDSALAIGEGLAPARPAPSPAARPEFAAEPWRAFYVARNFFELARRHGEPRWVGWHLLLSARRIQLAPDWPTRRAIAAGVVHGIARRSGRNPRYVREIGEYAVDPGENGTAHVRPDGRD